MSTTEQRTYHAPDGTLRSADRERELIRMALNSANGFAYWAPHERDWWSVFWEDIERSWDGADATGQRPLTDFQTEDIA